MAEKNSLNDIAIRMKQRRSELGLSLQEVSESAGISRSTLQRYEAGGIKNIPLHRLEQLAKALNTSADWLLGWCQSPNEITPVDADFKKLLLYLGFQIQEWPGHKSRIYISHGADGSAPISIAEYEQLRNSLEDYLKFNATNLFQIAIKRDRERLSNETDTIEAFPVDSSVTPK